MMTTRTATLVAMAMAIICTTSWAQTPVERVETEQQLVAAHPALAQDALTATVTVNANAADKPYNPMIFGGFLEHFGHQIYGGVFEPGSPLSDKKGFRKDVIAALKELKMPIVRWPGGCFVSGYHWKDGVGKVRQPTEDIAWSVIEPNTFGTDEFIELCKVAGWEPYICNNAGNGTVQEMKEWVEYCNAKKGKFAKMRKANGHEKPFNVKIWSIGNENWSKWEIGYKPIEVWSPLVLKAAKAMKDADPDLILSAAAVPTKGWTEPLLRKAGEHLDYLSIHNYWLPLWHKNEIPSYLDCVMKSNGPERLISRYIGILEQCGFRGRIKIAFDEWNLRAWHHPGYPERKSVERDSAEIINKIAAREKNQIASQYTMADALFTASFFNACLRHAEDVDMANIAPIVNTRGPLYVYPKGIVKRTHFHTMAMYANQLADRVVDSTIDAKPLVHGKASIPVVDGVVTANKKQTVWTIALVNRHPSKNVACTIKIKDKLLDGTYNTTILNGDNTDAFNSIKNPNRVVPEKRQLTFKQGVCQLPPHSLTFINVEK
jgi:alpha-N-arabinofuranosidase